MGAVVAPLTILGGPLLLRAAWYTAGIVGGLSTVAMCAPSEKFLNMGAPLGVGLGVVFVSSLGKLLPFEGFGYPEALRFIFESCFKDRLNCLGLII